MALKRITLRDFVIVDQLELELSTGFSVLTGETGAGKSILIDALQLALGERADASVVRENAARADICAEFDFQHHTKEWLQNAGFESESLDSLLLRRTIDTQGKSRAWINGSPATASQLRQLGELLLDIHGQHAWQSLTKADCVRDLLDDYAKIDKDSLLSFWQQWQLALGALNAAHLAQSNLEREQERLKWQITELEKLSPQIDEWDELSSEHTRQSHLQTLLEAAQNSLQMLEPEENQNRYEAENERFRSGALDLLMQTQTQLQDLAHLEPEFQSMIDVLASSFAQAQDAARSLQTYLRRTELDPERLQELDQRVALWLGLSRRFKCQPEELPHLLNNWKKQLSDLETAADLTSLERAVKQTKQAYQTQAQKISKERERAAPLLAKSITEAMQTLGMVGGSFDVALHPLENPSANGLEEVEFLVSAHKGSSLKPVAKVASGGELSRIALAISVTTSQLGQAATFIFDEVDSGIGGAVAQTVGQLMRQLGNDRQVLAVTHLAQVAAFAHEHWVVTKKTIANTTLSAVQAVKDSQRVSEIARMLGGDQSRVSLAHAQEMLENAQEKCSV